jgi:DNA-binding response OmpR family regulator
MNVLVIEDEPKLAEAISAGIQLHGHEGAIASSGEAGLRMIRDSRYDLVLMDVVLPGKSGLTALRELRQEGFKLPVLMLSSRDSIEDRVLGLDAGADDYLAKPFAFPELLARIRALQRRTRPESSPALQLSDLFIDLDGRIVSRSGKQLDLTAREFDLLAYLLLNRGTVVSRSMLARDVWGNSARHTSLHNVIDVQIARLRNKLDDPFSTKLLHTVRGVGFVLREEYA